MKQNHQDAIFCFSLSGLWFLTVHALLRSATLPRNTYFVKHPPTSADYAAVIVNVACLAAILFLIRRRRTGFGRTIAHGCIGFVAAISALGAVRSLGLLTSARFAEFIPVFRKSPLLFGFASVAVVGLLLAAFLRWRRQIIHVAYIAVMVLAPVSLWITGHAAYRTLRPPATLSDRPALSAAGGADVPRVLLIVFDEADFRLMFVDRPATIALPEVDRLRRESFFATAAYPPANVTLLSIPALTTGRMVSAADVASPSDLMLRFEDRQKPALWTKTPNLFQVAQDRGLSMAVVGWAHPYGRLFLANKTEWYEIPTQSMSMGRSFFSKLANQWRTLLETPRLSPFGQSLVTERAVEIHRALTEEAVEAVAHRDFQFLYLHFSVPHSPHIFDLQTGGLSNSNDLYEGYVGNLVLVDQTLRSIRRAAEGASLWNDTAVIVTSDHWCRYASKIDGKVDHRVPFLIKMPGQRDGEVYLREINTVILYRLILSIWRRDLSATADLGPWLDGHAEMRKPVNLPGFD